MFPKLFKNTAKVGVRSFTTSGVQVCAIAADVRTAPLFLSQRYAPPSFLPSLLPSFPPSLISHFFAVFTIPWFPFSFFPFLSILSLHDLKLLLLYSFNLYYANAFI